MSIFTKLFFLSLLRLRANKLECLSLVKFSIYSASLPDLLLSGMGLGAYPRRELKGALQAIRLHIARVEPL
jgi:hypothetical protein